MKQIVLMLCLVFISSFINAQELLPSTENGKRVYDRWCEPCHGRVAGGLSGGFGAHALPGTSSLEVKYKGELPAVLVDRTDLQPDFIRTVVRTGLYGMPITRKTEVSDSDLEDVIAYLTKR